jgi:hypothetical protein
VPPLVIEEHERDPEDYETITPTIRFFPDNRLPVGPIKKIDKRV